MLAVGAQATAAGPRDAGTRITVVVRVRPANPRELLSAQGDVVHVIDDRVLIFDPPGERIQKPTFLQTFHSRAKDLHFGFDKVLGPTATQEDVFEVVKNSVFSESGGLLDGFNCTVFAYGATGSGKTFSMAGTPDQPGLMSRAVAHIFQTLGEQGRRAKLKLSYLEIYNEQVRDLLAAEGEPAKKLKIVEHPENGMSVTQLRHCYPENTDQVLELIQIGNSRRTQAQTDSNPVSSRSHAVCQIVVENCDGMPGITSDHPIGKLSLIDLAGSERATTNTGIRLKESAKINCSLLALSNCINALCTQSSFIPFRQSKLTRLLKDSLGGNCKTVCLSCVSPSYLCYEDTYSTLQYANKTKNIRTNLTRNTLNVKARVSQYPKIIAELTAQIQVLQSQGGRPAAVDAFQKALEAPFNSYKFSIQSIVNRELQELPEFDVKQQILALQRMANSDVKRRLAQKLAAFNSECNKKRPPAAICAPKVIDEEQRLRVLELENCSLRAQLELNERQLAIHEQVMEHFAKPKPELVSAVAVKDPFSFATSTANGSSLKTMDLVVAEAATVSFDELHVGQALSARRQADRRVSISDTSRIRTPVSTEASQILRLKFQEAQKMQLDVRRQPLADKDKMGTANLPVPVAAKTPIRMLMDQLSQKVAAASNNLNVATLQEQPSLLQQARLLAPKTLR
jgi:hypothetical protein